MNRRGIPVGVFRALLANSGNQCTFPGCAHPIINDQFQLVAQLIHIEAVQPGGQRFNSELSTELVNGYSNLMFLCYRHHIETNDIACYDVPTLQRMKQDHESSFSHSPFVIDMAHVYRLKQETEIYWRQVEYAHLHEHIHQDLKMDIEASDNFDVLHRKLLKAVDGLENLADGFDPDDHKYFEIIHIGFPNWIRHIRVLAEQMQIKHLELAIQLDPSNQALRNELEKVRIHFLGQTSKTAVHVD